ncbi:hypothetical protein ABVK25_008394 [Lepraria finkii]|uniref:Uncharacterized protein n=1 Tax=Lepraria finkii TaxID=1340010 RepID=A0ABR4B0B8_9LECA
MLQDTYKVTKSYRAPPQPPKPATPATMKLTSATALSTLVGSAVAGPILERSTVYDERNDNIKRNLVARQKNPITTSQAQTMAKSPIPNSKQ